MLPAVDVDVPDAAALAGEDHFVLRRNNMHTTGVRVDQQRAAAASTPRVTGLRDDDVGIAFGVRAGVRRRTRAAQRVAVLVDRPRAARASPTTTATASARVHGDAWLQ